MEKIKKRWHLAVRETFHRIPTLSAEGLVLGYGTLLFKPMAGASRTSAMNELQRALSLLQLAGLDPPPYTSTALAKALADFAAGDRCLAHIRLAQLGLGAIDDVEDARRLFLGAAMLDAGAAPSIFACLLDSNAPPGSIAKYDPAQPRVPAGSGEESGRWARIAGAVATLATLAGRQAARAAAEAVPSLAEALSARALAWLAGAAAEAAAPAAFLGAVLIPSPNGGIAAEGEVPGQAGLRYRLDRDTGLLRLFEASDGEGAATAALTAQLGADGLYHEVDTGVAVARAVGGAVLLDIDRASAVGVETAAQARKDQAKLCPAPQPDRLGGRRLFDEMYEQYVRNFNNPQRQPQLPPGLTFALPANTISGWVHHDDCRESDGTMIEAKGNYGDFLRTPFGKRRLAELWLDQAERQLAATGSRRVEWYFHSPIAAAFARGLFTPPHLAMIGIHVLPHPLGVPRPNPRVR